MSYTRDHLIPLVDEGLGNSAAVVMCGHGERAMTAASLLQRAGRRGLAVLAGGAGDWAAATGRSLQEGT